MTTTEGMEMKYTVVNNEDIEKYLHPNLQRELNRLLGYVSGNKEAFEGKKVENTYLVINTDEPYVNEITEIMKKNGHWG
ncbi:hypothetical protein GJU41_12625 [Bacillus idriensis]|uniref:Uncharacterized protein n=1 Tax=Metabacillus idriensis TaxID=324768 RepID=A0A6I2MAL7_9BACI|nr:hypothetical protein [Metabacillus idriensis]MRX54819.1 hypothetical protein [Metabacillus idriensis]